MSESTLQRRMSHSKGQGGMRWALGLGLAVLAAVGARWWWDADYRAEEGALIGQVPMLLLAVGFVVGVVARLGAKPMDVPATVLLMLVAASATVTIGGLGDGFVGLRPSAFVLGAAIAAIGTAAGAGLVMVGRSFESR